MADGMDASLAVAVEPVGNAMVVRPAGDVDLNASPVLREQIQRVLAKRPRRVVIDLAGVPYMDSSGVATLVEAMQIARRDKVALVLCALQERVQAIFEIARLDTVFKIEATLETALVE